MRQARAAIAGIAAAPVIANRPSFAVRKAIPSLTEAVRAATRHAHGNDRASRGERWRGTGRPPTGDPIRGAVADVATFKADMESSEYRRMRAGEFVHYQANFLKLFQHERSPAEVDDIARAAISLRQRRIDEFDD